MQEAPIDLKSCTRRIRRSPQEERTGRAFPTKKSCCNQCAVLRPHKPMLKVPRRSLQRGYLPAGKQNTSSQFRIPRSEIGQLTPGSSKENQVCPQCRNRQDPIPGQDQQTWGDSSTAQSCTLGRSHRRRCCQQSERKESGDRSR